MIELLQLNLQDTYIILNYSIRYTMFLVENSLPLCLNSIILLVESKSISISILPEGFGQSFAFWISSHIHLYDEIRTSFDLRSVNLSLIFIAACVSWAVLRKSLILSLYEELNIITTRFLLRRITSWKSFPRFCNYFQLFLRQWIS